MDFFFLFPNRDQFGTNNSRPQKHDTKGNSAGWQISPLPQISFLLEDQIGSIWGCLCLPNSSRQRGAAPVAATRPFCFRPPVLSACHQIPVSHFVTLFQSADRFFSPGYELPPCVEKEVPSAKLHLTNIPGCHLIGRLWALWDKRVMNQGPLSASPSPQFALVFIALDALSKFGSTLEVRGDHAPLGVPCSAAV